MRINVFSGARRFALVVGICWLVGCAAYGIFHAPYIYAYFAVNWPGTAPVIVADCGPDDAREYIFRFPAEASGMSGTLCFSALAASDGRMLIPYGAKNADGRWLMNAPYEPAVKSYTRSVAQAFIPSQANMENLNQRVENKLSEQHKEAFYTAAIGIAVWWAIVFIVGWIMRGFLGIPRSHDSRSAPK
jgi:hypothetical protein